MELTSEGIGHTHGVDFLGDRTLAVANRDGLVTILEIPAGELAGRHSHIDPIQELSGGLFCKLKSPGSIAARRSGKIVAMTCEEQPLAFFALDEMIGGPTGIRTA